MRKTDTSYLGEGFSPLVFWAFNGIIVAAWMALKTLAMFAQIGIRYIFSIASEEVSTSCLGMLGSAFVNLMFEMSVLILAILISMVWVMGIVYIVRKELYGWRKSYFQWGDL